MAKLHNPLDLAAALGYSIHLDWDNSLLIEPPASIDVDRFTALLREDADGLKNTLLWRARRASRQFVGGPLAGRRHEKGYWSTEVLVRIARAKWVAYEVLDLCDGRAYFRGEATSEKKARLLIRDLAAANRRERNP